MIRLGSEYGGKNIPSLNKLNKDSICYLAGAGEDISFDVELLKKYECECHIFDPTPRAKIHFDNIKSHYDIEERLLNKLHFHQYGVYNIDGQIQFYEPINPSHVSHSIDNLQRTTSGFVADVKTIKTIMNNLNHSKIDLLKLDIEGAEYAVILNMFKNNINPDILLVEFHYDHHIISLTKDLLTKNFVKDQGYNYFTEDYKEVTFVKI